MNNIAKKKKKSRSTLTLAGRLVRLKEFLQLGVTPDAESFKKNKKLKI